MLRWCSRDTFVCFGSDFLRHEARQPRSDLLITALTRQCVSATYELKNNCCFLERFFKIKKNGFFLIAISYSVLEYRNAIAFCFLASCFLDIFAKVRADSPLHSIVEISWGSVTCQAALLALHTARAANHACSHVRTITCFGFPTKRETTPYLRKIKGLSFRLGGEARGKPELSLMGFTFLTFRSYVK